MAAMAGTTVVIVVLRYAFDQGAIAAQESVIYMHATAFMLGIAFTLKRDEHVRVDIIYTRLPARGRAWVDLCGHLLLLLCGAHRYAGPEPACLRYLESSPLRRSENRFRGSGSW